MGQKPVAAWDTTDERPPDPRIEQLRSLVAELIIERAQMGMDCLKAGDDRAELFFGEVNNAAKHFRNLLAALGEE